MEDMVKLELLEVSDAASIELRPFNVKGRVLVELSDGYLKDVLSMRSIHHVMEHIHAFNVEPDRSGLERIYRELRSLDLSSFLKPGKTFRITSERVGKHDYTSIDVQRYAGQAIVDSYGNKVNLKNFDVEIRVDVINDVCIVGICLTRISLHRRGYRVFDHPAALNPTIAYGMLRLSGLRENETLVDPMAGGGTIPIEAALYKGGNVRAIGIDIVKKYVMGAMENAKSVGVWGSIDFIVSDVGNLSNIVRGVDRIVTNPPYGVRMEPRGGVAKLYRRFADAAYKAMRESGRLVTITLKRKSMMGALVASGFLIVEERKVLHGDIMASVIVAEK